MNSERRPADMVESPRREPRLPPGQVLTDKWPVLHHGQVPRVDLATWDLVVDGLVGSPQRWTWEGFQALPRTRVHSDIHCVTRWSRYDNTWDGVSLRDVAGMVSPAPLAP